MFFKKLKAGAYIVAFRREEISFLGFAFGQGVGFEVAAVGRSDGQGLIIVVEAEAQIEARIEKLAREGGFSAKTVDGPALSGAKLFAERQNDVESSHHMERHRAVMLLGEGDLCGKDGALRFEIGTAQPVEAAFAHLYHLGEREQVGKGIEIVIEHKICVCCPPRMDAGGIERAVLWLPQQWTAHDGLWQTHNTLAGRGVEAVGVEIKEGLFLLHSSRYRVISVPTPRMAAQNAAHGEPKSFERAVFAQGFDGIL